MVSSLVKNMHRSPWDDFEDKDPFKSIFSKTSKTVKEQFGFGNFAPQFNFSKKVVIVCGMILALVWLGSGIYEIKEGEEAAIIRFGKFVRKGFPGLNYHLPSPIESIVIEKVNKSRRIEIGYRSSSALRSNDPGKSISAESTMLTGDENIVELNCDVMWHIVDLEKFIFNVIDPEEAVKIVAESAIREIIGKTPIASVLSSQKQEIADKIEILTQKILDQYGTGVRIEKVQLLKAEPPAEVIDAYRDVQTSRADKEREINQAQAYRNDVLPKARGESAKLVQEAEGYKQEIIAKAIGDTKRYLAISKQYTVNKQLTKDRLYLETLEEVLNGASKVVVGTDGLLPHMSLKTAK